MGNSQKRAVQNYRSRLSERGLARFEVLGRDTDRDLIRALARRLAEDGADASRLRAMVGQAVSGDTPGKGGILAALRRSPLVGADLDLARPREDGRREQGVGEDALEERRGPIGRAEGHPAAETRRCRMGGAACRMGR